MNTFFRFIKLNKVISFLSLFITLMVIGSAYGKTAKSTVVLLSIDGFSYDYLQKYQPRNILAFAQTGVSSRLLPVYPSKTFPNHLSIITGVYPANHGIVHNSFYHPALKEKYRLGAGKNNPAWLTAQPFWSFTQEHQIKSAVYFWPELQAKGQGRVPNYYVPYNTTTSEKSRFDQIIDWLKLPPDQAPQFIASYFSSVDAAGHDFGPNSFELQKAVTNIDDLFGHFIARLQQDVSQNVNVILLSDHGMVSIDNNKQISLSQVFNEHTTKLIADQALIIAQSSTQLYVYFEHNKLTKNQLLITLKNIKARQKNNSHLYSVYNKGDYPEHWQLNKDLVIIPDMIIEAKPTASFINEKYTNTNAATHGYDPLNQGELEAIFIAAGPNIRKGRAVKAFENIHIVPFMSQLLGIKQPKNIDGNGAVLTAIVK